MPALLSPYNIGGTRGQGPFFGFETGGGNILSPNFGHDTSGAGFVDKLKIFGKNALPYLLNFIPRRITDYIVASTPLLETVLSKDRYKAIKPFLTQLKTIQTSRRTLDALISPGSDTVLVQNPIAKLLTPDLTGMPKVSDKLVGPEEYARLAQEMKAKSKITQQQRSLREKGGALTLTQAMRKITKKGRLTTL